MVGAHFDSWAGRHRRDGQRGRLGDHARGNAYFENSKPVDEAHGPIGLWIGAIGGIYAEHNASE